MRITYRDVRLLRDLALSHALSRDQIVELGYFGSVTRVNTRLRGLRSVGFVERLETPFFSQSLYTATKRAADVVGERVSPLLESRKGSPRFLRHALSVTNVRLALLAKAEGEWRFEQQLWRKLERTEVRPDGLFVGSSAVFVEVDLGHVSPAKFKQKLLSYQALAHSGKCQALYGFPTFRLLTVTTGELRARHLRRLLPPDAGYEFLVRTLNEVGAAPIPSWS